MIKLFTYSFLIVNKALKHVRQLSDVKVMKVLNVAEKNDAAKNIAQILSNGHSNRREGYSKFNKIYEFYVNLNGQKRDMIMTSVSGHLLTHEFIGTYRGWQSCSPESLFDAPVTKVCPDNFKDIKRTLEREVRSCDTLIIWTDCDREGENIGFEIIQTCTSIKRNLNIYRAKFSEITAQSIRRALQNLGIPDKRVNDAVDVRSELDLRIGAAFTRFQTLRMQRVFPNLADYLLSYGSCQFPTLGFVVERYKERENFIAETFWKIKVLHTIDDVTVEFRWARDRLFNEQIVQALLAHCQENSTAKVLKVDEKPKSKWRPLPLDTVELEKNSSRKLKINAKETLKIAEKLYTQGYISYPRTETNIFPPSLNLQGLVEEQAQDTRWGQFATKVLQDGPNPRQGKKSDQSHPPIHPTKYINSLSGNEARVYEFIVRHFLACVSNDAKGRETIVTIDINNEKFTATGLVILEKNYLEVYPYEKWSAKEIHNYQVNQTFQPTILDIVSGETTAPNLLTEADLIALMEKHGIGTDATHAEHIETIKSRFYVALENNIYFVPGAIGMGLVEGYDSMGFEMSKPKLRAELEADLKKICEGVRLPQDVLKEQIDKYRTVFQNARQQVNKLDISIGKYIQAPVQNLNPEDDPTNITNPTIEKIMPCPSCSLNLILRITNGNKFVSCEGYPNCTNGSRFPSKVEDVKVTSDSCRKCGNNVKLLEFKFKTGSMIPFFPDHYIGCINGCDPDFNEVLDIRLHRNTNGSSTNNTESANSSTRGFSSNFGNSTFRNSGNSNSSEDQRRGQKRNRNNLSGKTDDNDDNDSGRGASISSGGSNFENNNVNCTCGIPARKFTVKKEGPTKGREFYCCSKQSFEKCKFFLWADESSSNQSSTVSRRNNFSNNNNNYQSSNQSNTFNQRTPNQFKARGNRTVTNTRKCSLCRQEGHTKRYCPQNRS